MGTVADNRSLNEFLDNPQPTQSTSQPDIELTYQSIPDGIHCPECNETVTKLWNSDDGLVCENCKHW